MKGYRLKPNLQFFAATGEGDAGGTSGAGEGDAGREGGSGASGAGEGDAGKDSSFDNFLKEEGNRAEFDRRVQEAVDRAVSAAQEKWKLLTDDKVTEAEKLAKMSKDEKAQYLQQKKESELVARERAITQKELMAEAKTALADKKLPMELAAVLDYTDADACRKSMQTVGDAFQKAVELAVDAKLQGGKPPKNPEGGSSLDKVIMDAMMGV